MTLQTEFPFVLPRGYVDAAGKVHKQGVMRLATAMDEIVPLRDPRVRANPAYLTIILLSRVVTRIGDIANVTTGVIEGLFASDMAYLQSFYRKVNEEGTTLISVTCPECKSSFEMDLTDLGGSLATP
jgi:hypothetical protein